MKCKTTRRMRFFRFAGVGAVGFCIDAGILAALAPRFGPFWSRGVSFPVAVSATWLLNRWLVFSDRAGPKETEYARYFVVQGAGAAINLATYAGLIVAYPSLGTEVVVPLAVGAAVALVFNYVASKRFVFVGVRSSTREE